MKRILALCILAFTLASFPLSIVCGAPMTIVFRNGTTVTYDTDEIESITFSGAPAIPAASPSGPPFAIAKPPMIEDFDNGLGDRWDPVAVVGGDFGRFARFEQGNSLSTCPAATHGKTGIQSGQPIFTVDRSFATQPGLILIKTDPKLRPGLVTSPLHGTTTCGFCRLCGCTSPARLMKVRVSSYSSTRTVPRIRK